MDEHKFQDKMEVTYEQYFKSRFGGMVEIAKEMERELGREKMLEIIGRASDKASVENILRQLEGRSMETFDDFVSFLEDMADSPFHKHSTTMTREKEPPNKLKFNVTECLWAKTFQDMGEQELGYVICCKPDFAMSEAVNPKIKLKRTKTLMQGDECCDHVWSWED
jgi:hypothetical protein